MGMAVGKKGGPSSDINVTPLIDIVLVLLIIFMVLTPSMLRQLPANVPKKDETQQPDPSASPIVLEMSDKEELALNTEPLAWELLEEKVKERLRLDRQKVVFFKIDDKANYGKAVKAMDVCKGAGAKVLGIMTSDK